MLTLKRQDGFTLVELMMSTAITLIVLATATGTFKNALLLNDTATIIADSNQNLRSGAQVFIRDLMQAGRGIPTGGIPIPSGIGATALVRPGPVLIPAVVLNFNNTAQTTLTAVTTGYRQGPLIAGRPNASDIVTMLALDPTSYVAYPALSFKQMPLNSRQFFRRRCDRTHRPGAGAGARRRQSDRRPVLHLDQRSGERHQGGRPPALHQRQRLCDSDRDERQRHHRLFCGGRSLQLQSARRRGHPGLDHADPRCRRVSHGPTWSGSRC